MTARRRNPSIASISNETGGEPSDPIATELFAGRKIQAIKLYHQQARGSLADAKDAVEAREAELRQTHPDRFKHDPGAGGCASVILITLTFGAAASVAFSVWW